jgi:hypothetical protein
MVVESVSAVATSTTVNLTIVKPVGLAVGDLMVATISFYSAGNTTNLLSIQTRSGWTQVVNRKPDTQLGHNIQYKIAESSDVAASAFSFIANISGSDGDQLVGQLIRASGQNTLNPKGVSSSYSNTGADSATFAANPTSYTPGADGALVVALMSGVWEVGGSFRTVSSPTLTSGATMTEGYDVGATDSSGGAVTSSAYGIQTTDAAITAYGATFTFATDDHHGEIVVFLPPVNQSGTNTLVETTTTTFTQAGTCDTIGGTNVLTEGTGVTLTQTGVGTSPTQWTNEAKPSTTWVNETK